MSTACGKGIEVVEQQQGSVRKQVCNEVQNRFRRFVKIAIDMHDRSLPLGRGVCQILEPDLSEVHAVEIMVQVSPKEAFDVFLAPSSVASVGCLISISPA